MQMRQLLQNLIANALKFRRPEESPVVRIEGRWVGKSAGDETCRMTIEDNGIGFEERQQELIFGVFQRLHTRDIYEGTGIGLALCRKIVEHHGGRISARSTPGKGSTFEVLLPAVQRTEAE
jgi:signal transduction histidine kinase